MLIAESRISYFMKTLVFHIGRFFQFRDLTCFNLQVYDLADEKPEEVLIRLLGHLEKLKEEGDETTTHVRTHLRMIVSSLIFGAFLQNVQRAVF